MTTWVTAPCVRGDTSVFASHGGAVTPPLRSAALLSEEGAKGPAAAGREGPAVGFALGVPPACGRGQVVPRPGRAISTPSLGALEISVGQPRHAPVSRARPHLSHPGLCPCLTGHMVDACTPSRKAHGRTPSQRPPRGSPTCICRNQNEKVDIEFTWQKR